MTAAILWQSVVESYETTGLIQLTNLRNRAAEVIDTAVGESAAQEVIDLWPVYAQQPFEAADGSALAVGRHAVIAVLWRRGGMSLEVGKVEWDHVFGPGGMVEQYKQGTSRAQGIPKSNSRVRTRPEAQGGRMVQGWSDRDSLPHGVLPRQIPSDGQV